MLKVFLIFLIGLICSSGAIRCFNTAGFYGKVPQSKDSIECPPDVNACLGAVYKGKVDGIKQHTSTWTCDYQHQYKTDSCNTEIDGDLTATVCFCHADLCNAIANVPPQ